MAKDATRLSCPPHAHYAVRREAAWKKDVWPIASARPRRLTLKRCARALARRSPIPTTRAAAKAIAAPPVVATSSSWNGTTGRRRTGTWPASLSATCASTTTCRFATLARLAMSHRRASCVISWTRHSTRFDRPKHRSRSAATQRRGSRSFAQFLASTLRARSIVGRTTGRSGDGIASTPAKLRNLLGHPRNSRAVLGRRRRLHRRVVRRARPAKPNHPVLVPPAPVSRVDPGLLARVHHRAHLDRLDPARLHPADLDRRARASLHVGLGRLVARVVHRGDDPLRDPRTRAESFPDSIARKGRTTQKQ